jgi:RNA polymerase sigma-70 factor (ECF subfamily)
MTADSANGCQSWETSTSRSLLSAAKQDDADAWQRLVRLYAPLVASWCRRSGVTNQDIADVLQDVFAAVARNLDRFRKERPADTFRGWPTITRNKVHDYYRHRGEDSAAGGTEAAATIVLDPFSATDTDDPADDAVLVASCGGRRCLGEFHQRTWRAFWGQIVEGRTAAEIGENLHMQPGHVRVANASCNACGRTGRRRNELHPPSRAIRNRYLKRLVTPQLRQLPS